MVGPDVDGKDTDSQDFEPIIAWQDSADVFAPPVRPIQDFLDKTNLQKINPETEPYIFFEESAYCRMLANAKLDTSREHGGILAGEVFEDPGGRYYVVIRSAIAAENPNSSSTHLQFLPESWKPIWDELYLNPALKILGWYHTHPRLGVFLSGTDLRTQRLYFSAPWQVAVVIDPVFKKIGYFFGSEGKRTRFVRQFSEKTNTPHSQSESEEDAGY